MQAICPALGYARKPCHVHRDADKKDLWSYIKSSHTVYICMGRLMHGTVHIMSKVSTQVYMLWFENIQELNSGNQCSYVADNIDPHCLVQTFTGVSGSLDMTITSHYVIYGLKFKFSRICQDFLFINALFVQHSY